MAHSPRCPNTMLGPTSWPLTLTPERSTATQSSIVCLWCSLAISPKRCPRTERRVRVTHRDTAAMQLTLYPGASRAGALCNNCHTTAIEPTCTRTAVPHGPPWVFTVAFVVVRVHLNGHRASIGIRLHYDPVSTLRHMQLCVWPLSWSRKPEWALHCEVYAACLHSVQLNSV